jgi:signal transduction histidine kinase
MTEDHSDESKETGDHPVIDTNLGNSLLGALDEFAIREGSWDTLECRAFLLVFSSSRMPAIYPAGDRAVIGRGGNAAICIQDDSLSRRHAQISRQEDGTFLIEDLGSRHGTRVNGEVVQRRCLASGDRLQFGGVRAVVVTFGGRFEELLLELQAINAIHTLAVGAGLGMGNTNQAMREALTELKRRVLTGGPTLELLAPLVKQLEQGLLQNEALAQELLDLAKIGDHHERSIPLFELLNPVFREISFPVYPPFQLLTDIEPHLRCTCNPDLLRQALMELAVNAIEAMPAGGTLKISARQVELGSRAARAAPFQTPGPYLRIVVSDSGAGMPSECCRRAFEPFFSTKPSYKRSGLGLTRVQHIVKSHLGFITVTSALGEGTSVAIHLPLPTVEEPEP